MPSERRKRRLYPRQLGRMARIEDAASFLLVQVQTSCELRIADAGIADRQVNRCLECHGRRHTHCVLASLRRRSEEHTSELQSRLHLVCRLLLEKKKNISYIARGYRELSALISPLYLVGGLAESSPVRIFRLYISQQSVCALCHCTSNSGLDWRT